MKEECLLLIVPCLAFDPDVSCSVTYGAPSHHDLWAMTSWILWYCWSTEISHRILEETSWSTSVWNPSFILTEGLCTNWPVWSFLLSAKLFISLCPRSTQNSPHSTGSLGSLSLRVLGVCWSQRMSPLLPGTRGYFVLNLIWSQEEKPILPL